MGERTWIFAYGSLVSPSSLESTIGRRVAPGRGMHVAALDGWARRWNYGSKVLRGNWDHTDDAGKQQSVVGGLVESLGVVAAFEESINGVVFDVDDDELADLDWRERAYDRVDVSENVTLLDGSSGSTLDEPVAVYVPLTSSIERYERARDDGTAAIRRFYWDLVDEAFGDLGDDHRAWYRHTQPPDIPVVDIVIDPLPSPRPGRNP